MSFTTPTFEDKATRTEAIRALRSSLSGGIALPGDESYMTSCHVWNGAVTQRPAMIALCESTADVQAVMRVARQYELQISVRGGGHHWTGLALRDDGLVLDITRMRQIEIDPHTRVATVAGGALVKDVAADADAHGLLATLGSCGMVGMAGLTLGGGYGPLLGKQGLAADNLLSAEVVLADGERVKADADSEPDLFWALRGGGGNFGVVTSLQVRLHEKRHMLAGSIIYPWDEASHVLRAAAAFAATGPSELGFYIGMASGPDGQPALQIAPLWNGEKQLGERVMRDFERLGTPRVSHIEPMTYSEVLAPVDAILQQKDGFHFEVRTRWLPALTSASIEAIVAAATNKTSPHSMLFLHPFNGAAVRVASEATAFGVRCEHFLLEIIAGWAPDDRESAAHRRWARELWAELAPFSLAGAYANLLGPEDREQTRDAYGSNGAQLATVKRRYDPRNVFSSAIPLPD